MNRSSSRTFLKDAPLPSLAQIQHAATDSSALPGVMQQVLAEIASVCCADYARMMLSIGTDTPSSLTCCVAGEYVPPIREGHWFEERVVVQRAPATMTSHSSLPYFCDYLNLTPVTQLVAAPMICHDAVIGVVSLGYIQAQSISQDALEQFSALAARVALLLPPATALTFASRFTVDLSELYSQMPWAVMLVDEAGRVLCANQACSTILHQETEALRGMLLSQLLQATEGELPRETGEIVTVFLPSGERFLAEMNCACVTLDDGHSVTMVVLRDMSRERELYKERLKSAELEGITRTVATVNHEINNPLFGLIATVQLLRNEIGPASPSMSKKLERIEECCGRIQQIIDRLSRIIKPARRTYAAGEGMLDLTRATDGPGGAQNTHTR